MYYKECVVYMQVYQAVYTLMILQCFCRQYKNDNNNDDKMNMK